MAIPNFDNGARDLVTVSDVSNSPNPTTVTRMGDTIPTLRGALADISAATGLAYTSKPAMDAVPGTKVGQAARVTEGVDAGFYIWSSASVWVKTKDPMGDALTINAGKPFPLRSANRAGTTSVEYNVLSDLLLQVEVANADPLKVYRIAYQQNEADTGSTTVHWGWVLEEALASTYASGGAVTRIHHYTNAAPVINRAGGIQTVNVTPAERPNLLFRITLDASKLPAAGVAINSYTDNTRPAWSWIVDPSCCKSERSGGLDSLKVNKGMPYPLRLATRAGITSVESSQWSNALLAVRVINAQNDKFYRIAYNQNEATAGGDSDFGWILEEFDKATYATTGARVIIHTHTDPAPPIDRAGGVQTVRVEPVQRPGMIFQITLDVAEFNKTAGTQIDAYSGTGRAGYSWIVDPSCYELVKTSVAPTTGQGAITWSYTSESGGTVWMYWRSADLMYRLEYGVAGTNGLPDIRSLYKAPYGDISEAVWSEVTEVGTVVGGIRGGDWNPPFRFRVVNGGDVDPPLFYTGGNHGKDGNVTGPTAQNVGFVVLPDGAPADVGDSGAATFIRVLVVNDIMARNTLLTNRYALRQNSMLIFTPGSVELKNNPVALEDLIIERDNGPQTFTRGFQITQMWYGRTNTRVAFNSALDSGASSTFPDVWAAVFKHPDNGQLAVWMDRAFGAGNGQYVNTASPMIRGGGSGNTKFYCAVVADGPEITLAAGESYQWRGGWAWQAPGVEPAGFDGVISYTVDGVRRTAYATPDGHTTSM